MSARTTIPRLISLSLNIALHPLPAATLLWALTKAPPSIRYRIIDTFASLHDPDTLRRVVKALKWVLAFATTRLANRKLNHLALNSWRVGSEKGRWSFNTTGASEVAVITGGCGGIGELVVKRLIQRGVRVAVLDVKELPASLQGCMRLTYLSPSHNILEASSNTH
jgi:all-trans-retinol dehydrogenase (NAD+)